MAPQRAMIALVALTVLAKAAGLVRIASVFPAAHSRPYLLNDGTRTSTSTCGLFFHRNAPLAAARRASVEADASSAPASSTSSSSSSSSSSGGGVKGHRKAPTASAPSESEKVLRTRLTTDDKFHRDVKALSAFFQLHGHLRVPYYYVIPTNDTASQSTNWRTRRKTHAPPPPPPPPSDAGAEAARVSDCYPPDTHGLRLGLRVARMRKGELYVSPEHRARLIALGLPVGEREGGAGGGVDAAAVAAAAAAVDADLRWSARAHTSDQQFSTILAALKVSRRPAWIDLPTFHIQAQLHQIPSPVPPTHPRGGASGT